MKTIGGNVIAAVLLRESTKNELHEGTVSYKTTGKIKGWLDFKDGEKRYQTYKSPIEESTHIFICEYNKPLKADRLKINGENYDVLYIDNVMLMNRHFEIYLKKVTKK